MALPGWMPAAWLPGVLVACAMLVLGLGLFILATLRLRRTHAALGEFTRAVLDSISVEVAVLDREGVITAVNAPWRRFSELNAPEPGLPVPHTGIGANYLQAAAGDGGPEGEGGAACAGIRGVLQGTRARFDLEYPCHAPGRERWFAMSVTPLGDAGNGAVVTHEDITERRRAELALRASEVLLDRTGRIAGIGGWTFDLVTGAIEWTAQTARIHDIDPQAAPTVEEAIAFYDAPSRTRLQAAMAAALEAGSGYDLELALTTAKGRAIWVRTVAEVETVDGRPVRLLGTFQDITARRAMEWELRRNNELLGTALETLPCGICVFDAGSRLVAFNAEYGRLLALPARLLERPLPRLEDVVRFLAERGEYGPGAVEAQVREVVSGVMAMETQHFERMRPDGSTLEIRAARMPGGGVVATFNDISARRRAEASALRSTRLLSDAIDAIDEAFVLFGPDERLVHCNETYRALFGAVSHLVVPGATRDDLALISRSSDVFRVQADGEPESVAAQRAGDPPDRPARLRRLLDGRVLRALNKTMPDGHMVGILADVTELLRATEVAQQALLAKGQFLANIGHEIRTPINAILGLLALLQRSDLGDRQRDYVARTDGATRALLGMLNAVLDFSKIESGAMRLDVHPFELEPLLRELSLIVSANVGNKALDVRFDIDPALRPVFVGDAMRLQQVLVNLMGNALKFTEQGFVELAIRVLHRDTTASTVEFVVRDTGIGIAPENHERIFAGFTQAESSTTRRFGGTGLGLAISHRLVRLMGGTLRVESTAGRGSAFSFVVRLQSPPPAAAERGGDAAGHGRRVLLIADEPVAAESLARMARASGWAVTPASKADVTWQEVAAMHASQAFDLALVDGPGPRWHRPDAGRALPGTLPLLMTGSLHERERAWAASPCAGAGREAFLVKPFTAAMLQRAAGDLLGPSPREARTQPPVAVPAGRLAGLRILLVEDNPNNQLIAGRLLEDEGASVAIACDGSQALRALPRGPVAFDAVLMDLQMPVMDGFTAARVLRDDLGHRELPIVAMTANASPADRLACLAAGMNDHVGKPFDLDTLVALLRRETGRPAIDAAPAPTTAARPAAALATAARAGIDLPAALARLGGRLPLYAELLSSFIAQVAPSIARLDACVDTGDLRLARELLHTTRGLAGTLGVSGLARELALAEAACGGDAPRAQAAEAILLGCVALAAARDDLGALLEACERDRPAPGPRADPLETGDVRRRLGRVAGLLRTADMQALGEVKALVEGAHGELRPELEALDGLVGELQFERAAALCDALAARLRPA